MKFTVIEADQRSPEWHAARLGRLTGSRAADMLATIKSGEAAARRNLRIQLALERVTGKSMENGYQSPAMLQGIEREAAGLAHYEALTGQILTFTGFLACDGLMAGVSLDGHVGDFEGIVELKCPQPAAHWASLKSGTIPTDYTPQIWHGLWITGAEWCDWISYQPDFPPELQMQIIRVKRDRLHLTSYYEEKALAFLAEVEAEEQAIRTCANPMGQFARLA